MGVGGAWNESESESDEAREEERRKETVAYVDGLGNDLEFNEQGLQ